MQLIRSKNIFCFWLLCPLLLFIHLFCTWNIYVAAAGLCTRWCNICMASSHQVIHLFGAGNIYMTAAGLSSSTQYTQASLLIKSSSSFLAYIRPATVFISCSHHQLILIQHSRGWFEWLICYERKILHVDLQGWFVLRQKYFVRSNMKSSCVKFTSFK